MVGHAIVLWDESTNVVVREWVGPLAPAFETLTHLGDGAVLIGLAVVLYWFGTAEDRQTRAFVIAVGTAALALSVGLKGIFQIPRPMLAFSPEAYPGYTFPSAHALGGAAIYSALAVTMSWGHRYVRYLLAGAVITTVMLSRVVMGVHYLGDVLVGATLGVALVALGTFLRREGALRPGSMFAIATVIALVATGLGSRVFLTMTLGASFGGLVGWQYVKDRPTTDVGAALLVAGVIALAGLAGLRLLSLAVGVPVAGPDVLLLLGEAIGYGVLTALVLALPALATRIEDEPTITRLQSMLPFRDRQFDPDELPDAPSD